jgi:prepilin-type N-terminal cleavage/methylation domain-containing protein
VKRAFTLIELLVVIAIIAILAAILFPVFAQAKAQAKKAADLSNNKQTNLAAQMYLNDADDLYPLEAGQNAPGGTWYYGYRLLVQPLFTANQADPRVIASYGLAHNTIAPYSKNFAILLTPAGGKDVNPFAAGQYPNNGTAPELSYTYTYNGLLNSYNSTGMQSPATVPIWWSGWGLAANKGWAMGDPELFCATPGAPCTYIPATVVGQNVTCGTGNGGTGNLYGPSATWWVFSNGQNWAYGDGHAKFRKVGNTLAPATSNPYVEPFVNYNAQGVPGSYLWTDNCFPFLFRPDYVPPNGFN